MSGPQNTGRVKAILAAWRGPSRLPLGRAFLEVAGPFPVAGVASWSNDWHAFRACPYAHPHMGLDIFAALGTPVVAAEDGVVTQIVSNSTTGLGVEIRDRSGIEYFYAHLSAFAKGLHRGQVVRQGKVLGGVGTTGNAAGSAPHLHFEIQPGGRAMPPKPVVDRWLLAMEKRARVLVDEGKKALAEQKSEDSASLIGLLGQPPPPLARASLRTPATADGFPLPLGVAFAAIILIALGLEALRFTGRRPKEAWTPVAAPPGAHGPEATVSLLGLGIIVVMSAMAFAADRPGRTER